MAPTLDDGDTIEVIINNPQSVSWDTFKALGLDPASLISERRKEKNAINLSTLGGRYSSPYISGSSSLFTSPGKGFKYVQDILNRTSIWEDTISGNKPDPAIDTNKKVDENSNEEELVVFETEIIYLDHLPEPPPSEAEPEPELRKTVDNAIQLLQDFKLEEAEAMFLDVCSHLEGKPDHGSQSMVQALLGLAEITSRRSRLSRGNPMEGQWQQMHTAALLQYAIQLCSEEIQNGNDNQRVDWYREQCESATRKLKPIEDNFIRSLYTYLQSDKKSLQQQMYFSLSAPTTPTSDPNFPLSTKPLQHVFPGVRFQRNMSMQSISSIDETFPGGLLWVSKFQEYCKDRLQNKDSDQIVQQLFTPREETSQKRSFTSDGVLDFEDLKEADSLEDVEDFGNPNTPVKEYSLAYEIASSDVEQSGWDFFLEERKHCTINSVVQLAPAIDTNKEDTRESTDKSVSRKDDREDENEADCPKIQSERKLVSPLEERCIQLTLSKFISKLADRLATEKEYRKAEALYEQTLDIIDTIQNGTKGMLIFYAQTAKNLGMIRTKLGQTSSGFNLLQKALQTFRDVGDNGSKGDIARALLEVGNSYTLDKWDEETIFDHVIDVIREAFDKESSEEGPMTKDPPLKDSSEKSLLMSPTLERNYSFNMSIQEAILCYEEAITILENLPAGDASHSTLYARAITRLGDSHFVQKEYYEALDCYEKAQTLFRTTSGRNSLIQHGHVLCMLGVTSFMLHLYPKAARVYECAYRMLKHAFYGEHPYKMGMLLSLLGIASYKLQYYHKSVTWCFRAFDIYSNLYTHTIPELSKQKLWIVCQTLYILGNSYNVLNLHEKAIHYLSVGRNIMKVATHADRRQFMRILQILGDCYFAQYDYKTALTFYNEALEDFNGDSFQLINRVHQNLAEQNQSSDDKGLHNQLLSRSADAHLSMNEYQDAIGFLEQASNIQDVLEDDIKGDLVTTLHQLGNMHSMAGDVEQAIQSYSECLEIYREVNETLGPEMSIILGNLATMCYVKSCITDDIDQELEMILSAEKNFQEAVALENNPSVLVKYAGFLYSQGNYDDAVLYLHDALKAMKNETQTIIYSGLEKVALPEVLQDEIDGVEEVSLPIIPLIRYLLLISHKALGETKKAEDNLLVLMKEVLRTEEAMLYSLVGYSMMELGAFKEAAEFFAIAFHMQEEYHLATDNYSTCLSIMLLQTLQKSFENIYFYYK